jgi:hypothetical protein
MNILKKHKADQSNYICSFGLGYKGMYDLIFPNLAGTPQEPSNFMDKYTHSTQKVQKGIAEKLAERRHPRSSSSQVLRN